MSAEPSRRSPINLLSRFRLKQAVRGDFEGPGRRVAKGERHLARSVAIDANIRIQRESARGTDEDGALLMQAKQPSARSQP